MPRSHSRERNKHASQDNPSGAGRVSARDGVTPHGGWRHAWEGGAAACGWAALRMASYPRGRRKGGSRRTGQGPAAASLVGLGVALDRVALCCAGAAQTGLSLPACIEAEAVTLVGSVRQHVHRCVVAGVKQQDWAKTCRLACRLARLIAE